MQADAVHRYHWMTSGQFLDAVALGQVTPGPVVQTVAVVGYAAGGVGGGLLAAFVAFAPSFALRRRRCPPFRPLPGQPSRSRVSRRSRPGRDRRDLRLRGTARPGSPRSLAARGAGRRRDSAPRPAARGRAHAPRRRSGGDAARPCGSAPAAMTPCSSGHPEGPRTSMTGLFRLRAHVGVAQHLDEDIRSSVATRSRECLRRSGRVRDATAASKREGISCAQRSS